MAKRTRGVIGGVDTHGRTHHAAVIDQQGRLLAEAEFGAHTDGYRQLLGWLGRHGQLCSVGVEGTGTYGAGLTRFLLATAWGCWRLTAPTAPPAADAARATRSMPRRPPERCWPGSRPRCPNGATGSWRRSGCCAACGLVRSRPAPRRSTSSRPWWSPPRPPSASRWTGGRPPGRWRPAPGCGPTPTQLADPVQATKAALRAVAVRILALEQEIKLADERLRVLVPKAAPRTVGLLAIGIEHAGQLLVTAGDNPERLRGEAAFAHLCGAAPIPASSGRTRRHRLHRGGDRDANCALHLAVVVRMRYCPRTRAYVERRTKEGLSKPEIIRCVKRYLAREVYHAILADFAALHAT
jgi:transposase